MAKSYVEYRFPNGMIISQFVEDDEPFPPTVGEGLIEQLADLVRQQKSVKWSTFPTHEALAFHQLDAAELGAGRREIVRHSHQ